MEDHPNQPNHKLFSVRTKHKNIYRIYIHRNGRQRVLGAIPFGKGGCSSRCFTFSSSRNLLARYSSIK